MWRDEIDHWRTRFDVIAFDARGHGQSTHNGNVSVETIAEDLRESLQRLEVGPVHVVAISMGGPICANMYKADPSIFLSLVIADSFARQGSAGEERARAIEEILSETDMAAYGETYARGTIHSNSAATPTEQLAASVAAMDKRSYLELARSVFTADVSGVLSRIDLPVLVLVGADDTRTPVRFSEDIAGLIKGAKFQIIKDAAHLANLDRPAEFHAAADGFFNDIIFCEPAID
jgi:3-oxoadipate enol-lactonase